MIEVLETKDVLSIVGSAIEIKFLKESKSLSILSSATNFSITGVIPAINLFLNDQIITLLPDNKRKTEFIEMKIKDEFLSEENLEIRHLTDEELYAY